MPLTTIILLTGAEEWPYLSIWLRQQRDDVRIEVAETAADLAAIPDAILADARLCAFCTNVIVPPAMLTRLGYGAYNFHPGSPAYPGWAPASFARYDQAVEFGATAHEMTAAIDAGAIVDVELFAVTPDTTVRDLQAASYTAALTLFQRLAESIACRAAPLPTQDIDWAPHKCSRRAFARMCTLSPAMPETELDKRLTAFGHGDGISMPMLVLRDRRFRLIEIAPS